MSHFSVDLVGWEAWAPSLAQREAWTAWLETPYPLEKKGQPACEQVPALIRRRCGQNARMAMESLFGVCARHKVPPDQPHLVLGSPNGENHALRALLVDLCQDQPLSPTAFTNSLHHVPTGFYSIVAQHRGVSRTISAFEDTFSCGWVETAALLNRLNDRPAVLLLVDEIPPEPFDQMLAVPAFPYAVALLLKPADSPGTGIRFSVSLEPGPVTPRRHPELIFDFLRWFESGEAAFCAESSFGRLTWQRT